VVGSAKDESKIPVPELGMCHRRGRNEFSLERFRASWELLPEFGV